MAPVYLTKGKRGRIYVDKNKAIKKSEPSRVSNEVKWLKILNKKKIGPKFISSSKNSFSYNFVRGDFLPLWIEQQNSKKRILNVLGDVLKQCRVMDNLQVNKLEMHNPYKHIIVKKGDKPVMIDFERCYETKKPKNVTQFCQYITGKLNSSLKKKKINIEREDITPMLIAYKKDYSDKSFESILNFINQ